MRRFVLRMDASLTDAERERKANIIRAKRRKFLRRFFVILGVIAVFGGGIWALVRFGREEASDFPGEFYPSVGQEHIPLSATPPTPYNSNPPSSGAHYGTAANWAIYDYEGNDKIFIHNLEHGGIWITYRPDIPSGVIEDLKAIVDEYSGSKLVMSPRSANDVDVALVAWTRVQKFTPEGDRLTDSEKDLVRRFYQAYKNKGPEFVPDFMPGVDPKTVQ